MKLGKLGMQARKILGTQGVRVQKKSGFLAQTRTRAKQGCEWIW